MSSSSRRAGFLCFHTGYLMELNKMEWNLKGIAAPVLLCGLTREET